MTYQWQNWSKLYFWAQRPHSFYLISPDVWLIPLAVPDNDHVHIISWQVICRPSDQSDGSQDESPRTQWVVLVFGTWRKAGGHDFVDTDGLSGLLLVNLTRLKRHRDSQWSDQFPTCAIYEHGKNGSSVFLFLLKSNQNAIILWLDRLNPIIAQLLTPIQKSTILVLKPMVTYPVEFGEGPHWIIWMDIHT